MVTTTASLASLRQAASPCPTHGCCSTPLTTAGWWDARPVPDCTWLRVGRGPGGHRTGPRVDGRGSPPLAQAGLTHHMLHRGPLPENDGVREVRPLCTGRGWVGVSRIRVRCHRAPLYRERGPFYSPPTAPPTLRHTLTKSPNQAGSTASTQHGKAKHTPVPVQTPARLSAMRALAKGTHRRTWAGPAPARQLVSLC